MTRTGRYALLEIDKYPTIEWGVNCVFQSDDVSIARAMKLVKEDAIQRRKEDLDEDDLRNRTETIYTIIDFLIPADWLASITHWSIVLPEIVCKGLGVLDNILLPFPALNIIEQIFIKMLYLLSLQI